MSWFAWTLAFIGAAWLSWAIVKVVEALGDERAEQAGAGILPAMPHKKILQIALPMVLLVTLEVNR